MQVLDPYYTSLSDASWFLGNPSAKNKSGFNWSIDSTLYKFKDVSWRASASDSSPEELFQSYEKELLILCAP